MTQESTQLDVNCQMNTQTIQQIVTAYNQGQEAAEMGISKENTPMDGRNRSTFLAWSIGWDEAHARLQSPVKSKVCATLVASVTGKEIESAITPNKAREIILDANELAFRRGFEACASYLGLPKGELYKLEALRDAKLFAWDDLVYAWAQHVIALLNKTVPLASPPKIVKPKDIFRF